MRHLTRNTNLDVHHSLLPKRDKCYFESQALIDRCISGGEGLSVLSPADMVLHSAAHIFRIGDWANALRDLSDQDLMLREFGAQPGVWESLLNTAEALKLQTTCYYCLHLVKQYFDTDIPPAIAQRVNGCGPVCHLRVFLTTWSNKQCPRARTLVLT